MTIATVIRNVTGTSTGDAFADAEGSAEDSEPRELVDISINDGVTVYRHTSATRDIVYSGNTYTAVAMSRSEISVNMPGEPKELVITLPIDHPLARRFTRAGVPQTKISVTLYRQQAGQTECVWQGDCTSYSSEGRIARFRVPSRAGEWLLRALPTWSVGRRCNNVLFDENCGLSESGSHGGLAFKVSTTVIFVSGRDVRVDLGSTSRNGTWSETGRFVHTSSGEKRVVAMQTDLNPGFSSVADLSLNLMIPELKIGDAVDVFIGCPHTIEACHSLLGNKDAHSGMPALPDKNPHLPEGYGPVENT